MRVFVTGATGFIGRAVVRALIEAGHDVSGLARSDASAQALTTAGVRVHRGSLEDLESLRRGAAAAEGAIHTAYFHEFTHADVATRLRVMLGGSPSGIIGRFMAASIETDRRAIETIGRSLGGPDPALVVASGTLSMQAGKLATEDEFPDPSAVGGRRASSERTAIGLVTSGVRASVIRLPPLVHGEDDRTGFAPRLVGTARKKAFAAFVGDGRNHWPAVHRSDVAQLFRLALETGTAGARYHGVAEEGIPFRTIADAIGRRLSLPVLSKTPEEAAKLFSWLAPFIAADNLASSALTQDRLGWSPTGPGLIADLEGSWYFKSDPDRKYGT